MIHKYKSEADLEIIHISNAAAEAEVYLQGAHLTSWIPKNQEEVIWLSPKSFFEKGKPIRGGIPLCWPWFGNKEGFQAHGFARNLTWKFDEHTMPSPAEDVLKFSLETSDESLDIWPFRFKLSLVVSIGKLLGITLTTSNMDNRDFVISQALHTYFSISEINDIVIDGLEACTYLDKTDKMASKFNEQSFVIHKEEDTIFQSRGTVYVRDPGKEREIHINKSRSSSETVVWNPGKERSTIMADMGEEAYKTMVCVEAANTGDGQITLEPGQSHSIYQLISVHPYAP